MRRLFYFILSMPLLWLTACDVHEWPETPEFVKFHLRLHYETDMTVWNHLYDGKNTIEQGYGVTYDNYMNKGTIRYIVRAYPIHRETTSTEYAKEFVFTQNMANGYDFETTLELVPGDYRIMVWSDLSRTKPSFPFYEPANFTKIVLQGEHPANTDYRDAFSGKQQVVLTSDIMERKPDTLDIAMRRPLGKFEFITTDVVEFIRKEVIRLASRGDLVYDPDEDLSRMVNIKDYKIMFYYVGFMPSAYSVLTDMAVDSATGVSFASSLDRLNDREASLGFDYVFLNNTETAVTVKIGVLDKEDTLLTLSDPIVVPLKRDHHTILRGTFITTQASGGITINPEFDGDFNLIIP